MKRMKSLSKRSMLGVLLLGLLGVITNSHAALQNLGNGLVNDDTLGITWMQDANLVKTSCDANNDLWQAFDPTAGPNSGRNKTQICIDNGDLTWNEAQTWIGVLNNFGGSGYLGHNDWRLPNTAVPDPGCTGLLPGASTGYHCSGSELGSLFYDSFENENDQDDNCFGAAPHCLVDSVPFSGAQPSPYWSNTDGPNPLFAYNFHAGTGNQAFGFKNHVASNFHLSVCPVHPELSPIPPPQDVPT